MEMKYVDKLNNSKKKKVIPEKRLAPIQSKRPKTKNIKDCIDHNFLNNHEPQQNSLSFKAKYNQKQKEKDQQINNKVDNIKCKNDKAREQMKNDIKNKRLQMKKNKGKEDFEVLLPNNIEIFAKEPPKVKEISISIEDDCVSSDYDLKIENKLISEDEVNAESELNHNDVMQNNDSIDMDKSFNDFFPEENSKAFSGTLNCMTFASMKEDKVFKEDWDENVEFIPDGKSFKNNEEGIMDLNLIISEMQNALETEPREYSDYSEGEN